MILEVNQSFWKEDKWKNANKENIKPYNKVERKVHTKKRENLFLVQRRKKKSKEVHSETDKEFVWLSKLLQITLVFFVRKKDKKKRIVQDFNE